MVSCSVVLFKFNHTQPLTTEESLGRFWRGREQEEKGTHNVGRANYPYHWGKDGKIFKLAQATYSNRSGTGGKGLKEFR